MRELDRVLDDVCLFFDRWIDIYCRIGDVERSRVARGIDHKDMTHAPRSAELFLANDGTHEFVGMETPLHQRFDLKVSSKLHGFSRCRVAVLGRHKVISGDVCLDLLCCSADLGHWSNEDRIYETSIGGLNRP